MRIHLLSDVHAEFEAYQPKPVECDVVALLGDVSVGPRGVDLAKAWFPNKPILYVLGNHEFFGYRLDTLIEKTREAAAGTNVTVLENTEVILGGTRFLGCTLWTDFELLAPDYSVRESSDAAQQYMADYRHIRMGEEFERLTPKDTQEVFKASLKWLRERLAVPHDGPTVVLTHHAPSAQSNPDRFAGDLISAAFCSQLDWLIEDSKAAAWLHGHTHQCVDYKIGAVRVVSNQRGYPGESTGFNPELVVEV